MNGKFKNYLEEKFNGKLEITSNNNGINAKLEIENGSVNVSYKNDELTINANYIAFTKKHQLALKAFIDDYNEKVDKYYSLSIVDSRINLQYTKFNAPENQAISEVENVIIFFNSKIIKDIINSATARQNIIKSRVNKLMRQASKYEEENRHDLALNVFEEISSFENDKNLSIYERMAFLYQRGIKGENFKFPKNDNYALECYDLAVKSEKFSILLPHLAYKIAKKLGDAQLVGKYIELGKKCGTWDFVATYDANYLDDFPTLN